MTKGKKNATAAAAAASQAKRIVMIPPHDIKFDTALRVVSSNGQVLRKEALNTLQVGAIVRISMHISKKSIYDCRLQNDSPYVSIHEIKGEFIRGSIKDLNRTLPQNYYPLRTEETIWFKRENIIELNYPTKEKEQEYGTGEYVAYTGPLETIDYENDSSDYDDDSQGDSSASEGDQELDIVEPQNIKNKAPLMRGRQYAFNKQKK